MGRSEKKSHPANRGENFFAGDWTTLELPSKPPSVPEPLAAGTTAKVHRATLESGERVVVKVQRPTAEQDILQEVSLLEMFAQKAADRPAFRRLFDMPATIEHLSVSLRRELDFRREAANIRWMHEVLAPFPRLGVPV